MGYRGKVDEQNRARDLRAQAWTLPEIASELGALSDSAELAAGVALYAGEGSKTEGSVTFANSDTQMMAFFCAWFRHVFEVTVPQGRPRGSGPIDPCDQARVRVLLFHLLMHPNSSPDHGAAAGFAIVSCPSGVAQLAEHFTVNENVASSSLAPGAS